MNGNTGATEQMRETSRSRVAMQIESRTEENIKAFAEKSVAEITDRIQQLEREWDMERALEMSHGALALTGLALAVTTSRKWLLIPGLATSFLVWHSLKGWSPPVPLMRRAGVRTRAEIDREIYALKALRGDFQKIHKKRNRPQAHVTKAIDAVAMNPEMPSNTGEAAPPPEQSGEMTPAPGI